ncbi:MAG: D-alanyl-D-alanine carboxypeptidase [Defluviitaleaceae bacterium]|nr:D-alanyl-D-alanine carboxypeptidase [Defluviitaleaceae bacterium]
MRKIFAFILVFTFCLNICVAYADPSLAIDAKASLLMEAETGKILHEHNAHEKLAPASVTKVMTMLLIYEALDQERVKWDDVVTVSAHAASMGGSQIFLEQEEKQTVRDLVKSIVIASANDAAVAMAEFIAGSEEAFVSQMNAKAASLGMENTHFLNACGLDADGHLTTAHDIALMSRELILKYPEVFDYTTIRLDKIIHRTARGEEEFGLTNTNKLIRSYSGATGLKTGSTSQALYCISATAEKEGMQLIAVVLAAPDPTIRFGGAMKMFDYGYANYALVSKEETGASMGEVRVYKGTTETAPAVIKEQVNMLAPKGKHVELSGEVVLADFLDAPVAEGTVVGEVIYTWEGAEVGRSELIIPQEIERASVWMIMERLFERWIFSTPSTPSVQ